MVPTTTSGLVDSDNLPTALAHDLEAAFPDLVAVHQDGIYSGVLRFVRDAGEAEDITQETFVRSYPAPIRFETKRIERLALRPWLWTIALNLCRNAARDRSRRPKAVALSRVVDAADPADTAADALASVTAATWQHRLDVLGDPMRSAVILRHVAGLSYSEIATAVGRPVGTVKSDVHRGLARLRQMLTAELEEE